MKTEVLTACPLDCWDACSVLATVEDGRVTQLQGNPHHPITRGFLCGKTVRYPERVYSPDRILHPMLRREGDQRSTAEAFEQITWDQALDLATEKFRNALANGGPLSVLHFQGAGSMGLLKKLSKRFFNLLGGVTESAGDVCFGAGTHAMTHNFGEQTAHSLEDILHSRLVLLWGRDPFISNTHMLPFLKQARSRGAVLVGINPRRMDRTRLLDLQLQPQPGRDVFLALALLREFIERNWCDTAFIEAHSTGWRNFTEYVRKQSAAAWLAHSGISSEEFERLLALYHERRPAGIWIGSGLQHNVLGVEVVEALAALVAAAGNIGVPGGGLNFYPRHRKHFDMSLFAPRPEVKNRELPVGEFWKHLPQLDPPIQLMWVNGVNPVRSLPDSQAVAAAMRSIAFVVAVDFHWTDTVLCSDLVLPHTSFLEEGGMVSSYGHNYVALQQPAAVRVGEARTDLEIFQELAERLGIGAEMHGSEREWTERLMAPLFKADPSLCGKFFRDGFIENPLLARVPHQGGEFFTPDRKFHFPEPFRIEPERLPRAEPQFPLRLLTSKNKRMLNSQEVRAENCYEVRVHPATAAALALCEGARVRVHSVRGSIPAVLSLDDTLRVDVAAMPVSGSLAKGNSVNLLVPAIMAADGACPAYNDAFVRIELA